MSTGFLAPKPGFSPLPWQNSVLAQSRRSAPFQPPTPAAKHIASAAKNSQRESQNLFTSLHVDTCGENMRATIPALSLLVTPRLPSLAVPLAGGRLRVGGRPRTRLRVAAPTSVPGEAAEQAEPSTSAPESGEKFSWRDHWYPVSLVEDLDPSRPTPFQLLNRDLVIWKEPKSGEWVALDDRCPHRLAPLSVRRPASLPRLIRVLPDLFLVSANFGLGMCRRAGSMRRGACSARITDGHSMAPAPAPRSPRPCPRVLRPVRCGHRRRARSSSPPSSPRGCSSCGPMRMGGRKRPPPSLQCA